MEHQEGQRLPRTAHDRILGTVQSQEHLYVYGVTYRNDPREAC